MVSSEDDDSFIDKVFAFRNLASLLSFLADQLIIGRGRTRLSRELVEIIVQATLTGCRYSLSFENPVSQTGNSDSVLPLYAP